MEESTSISLTRKHAATSYMMQKWKGFTFGDGALPTSKHHSDLYAVHRDNTINYVGFIGHMAFGCAAQIGGKKLVRINYKDVIHSQQPKVELSISR